MSKIISSLFLLLTYLSITIFTSEIKETTFFKTENKNKLSNLNLIENTSFTLNGVNNMNKSFLEKSKTKNLQIPVIETPTNIGNTKDLININNYSTAISDPELKYTHAFNIVCNAYNCQNPNFCTPDLKACRCAPDSAEYNLYNNEEANKVRVNQTIPVYCNYKRKSQLVYFLLEFLLNIGVGHLYAGNFLLGGLKIGLVFLPCITFIVLFCLGIVVAENIKEIAGIGACIGILVACTVSIWWLVDAILIGIGIYKDGFGVPLQSW